MRFETLARSLTKPAFLGSWGHSAPFSAPPATARSGRDELGRSGQPYPMSKRSSLPAELIAMLTVFDELLVAMDPPLEGVEALARDDSPLPTCHR